MLYKTDGAFRSGEGITDVANDIVKSAEVLHVGLMSRFRKFCWVQQAGCCP